MPRTARTLLRRSRPICLALLGSLFALERLPAQGIVIIEPSGIALESALPSARREEARPPRVLRIAGMDGPFAAPTPRIVVQVGDLLPAGTPSLPPTLLLDGYELVAPGARMVAATDEGDRPVALSFVSYRGALPDAGWAVLSFTKAGVMGLIKWQGKAWVIEPLRLYRSSATHEEHVLYELGAVSLPPGWCGFRDSSLSGPATPPRSAIHSPSPQATMPLTAELAVETDYETYLSFDKDAGMATSYLLSMVATVSQLYQDEVNLTLKVVYSRVWTTAADPYTANGYDLYPEFRDYWNANMSPIARDFALLIIRDPGRLAGGMAGSAAECTNDSAYAVSGGSAFTIAHEAAHLFGSPHTHHCAWPSGPNGTLAPIDRCATVEGSCGIEDVKPEKGTIMSYCPDLQFTFHALVRNVIRATAETCSASAAPGSKRRTP